MMVPNDTSVTHTLLFKLTVIINQWYSRYILVSIISDMSVRFYWDSPQTLRTTLVYAHFSSHFSQQLLMAEIWYLVTRQKYHITCESLFLIFFSSKYQTPRKFTCNLHYDVDNTLDVTPAKFEKSSAKLSLPSANLLCHLNINERLTLLCFSDCFKNLWVSVDVFPMSAKIHLKLTLWCWQYSWRYTW
jgi:hypothetical protein